MEEVFKLNMFSEQRGNLYVVESDKGLSLDYSYYYILDRNIDLGVIGEKLSIIVISGTVEINNVIIEKGNMFTGVINSINNYSDNFISLIITNSVIELEPLLCVDFEVNRIFFVDNMPVGAIRGEHAHEVETEYLYVINGDFEVEIKDVDPFSGVLNKGESTTSLPKAWTSVKSISEDGVLLALLSHKYDASGFR